MAADDVAASGDSRLPNAYGGWNLSAGENLNAFGVPEPYVCEHGFVRCEGCEECASWADEVLGLD